LLDLLHGYPLEVLNFTCPHGRFPGPSVAVQCSARAPGQTHIACQDGLCGAQMIELRERSRIASGYPRPDVTRSVTFRLEVTICVSRSPASSACTARPGR